MGARMGAQKPRYLAVLMSKSGHVRAIAAALYRYGRSVAAVGLRPLPIDCGEVQVFLRRRVVRGAAHQQVVTVGITGMRRGNAAIADHSSWSSTGATPCHSSATVVVV